MTGLDDSDDEGNNYDEDEEEEEEDILPHMTKSNLEGLHKKVLFLFFSVYAILSLIRI